MPVPKVELEDCLNAATGADGENCSEMVKLSNNTRRHGNRGDNGYVRQGNKGE